jgi:DNA-binding protein H-NS
LIYSQLGNRVKSEIIRFLIFKTAMATYLELKQKAEKLMAEAEQMRQKEISDVIAEIREKMQTYGLTVQDIGDGANTKKRKAGGAAKTVKYRGPNGETWSGGRGRKPKWVQKVLKAGKNIEDFAV